MPWDVEASEVPNVCNVPPVQGERGHKGGLADLERKDQGYRLVNTPPAGVWVMCTVRTVKVRDLEQLPRSCQIPLKVREDCTSEGRKPCKEGVCVRACVYVRVCAHAVCMCVFISN